MRPLLLWYSEFCDNFVNLHVQFPIPLISETPTKSNPSSGPLSDNNDNMSSSVAPGSTLCDKQFAVIVSEKQARIVALPSHECLFKQQLTDTDFAVKADVVSIKGMFDFSHDICVRNFDMTNLYAQNISFRLEIRNRRMMLDRNERN